MKKVVKIEKLDNFGRGMSYYDGKPLFVENAIDGEVVECTIENEYKKNYEGICKKVIEQSNKRCTVKCPYYKDCGGCNIMHLNYKNQLDFKYEKVKALLKKFANINEELIEEIIPSINEGYRNKVTLKVNKGIGFYKRRTYDLIEIDNCIVCNTKINEVIKELKGISLKNIDEVIIRCTDKESMLIFKILDDIDNKKYIDRFEKKVDNLIVIKDGISTVLFGKGFISEKLGDYHFKISPTSFFQVNTNGAEKLYNSVLEFADLNGNETVLDLYCGTGTIGTYVSSKAKKVIGIEINSEAVEDANENIKINNVTNVEFICDDVGKRINEYKNIDLVIMDPPRNGLNKKTTDNILKILPKKIVYVSCDPATLARDINNLSDKYLVKKIRLVDMFPNTYHCESITVLERR